MTVHATRTLAQRLREFGADTGSSTHDELNHVALTDTMRFGDRG